MVPIDKSRAKHTYQSQCDVDLTILFWFRFENPHDRRYSSHNIHAIRISWQDLQNWFQLRRKASFGSNPFLEFFKFCFRGKCFVKQQIDDFLKDTVFGQVLNWEPSIVQASAQTNSRDVALACDNTGKSSCRWGWFLIFLRHTYNILIAIESLQSICEKFIINCSCLTTERQRH